mmetsp:Transcript_21620/g.61508  ORF Transcript_21620/g.61508 Transcript_21620/m.61508 type:complete len:99 (-) Transcript_21620:51-347(-)
MCSSGLAWSGWEPASLAAHVVKAAYLNTQTDTLTDTRPFQVGGCFGILSVCVRGESDTEAMLSVPSSVSYPPPCLFVVLSPQLGECACVCVYVYVVEL